MYIPSDKPIAMALSVKADETALELFRRSNRSPLRTGIAFLDEVMRCMYPRILNSILNCRRSFPLPKLFVVVAFGMPGFAVGYHGTLNALQLSQRRNTIAALEMHTGR